MAAFVLGKVITADKTITTLNWIKPGAEATTEALLGYENGRLSRGYWIGLMTRMPTASDFRFDGTTLNSGGKVGLPADTPAKDATRTRVHDVILAERGTVGYQALQKGRLASESVTGPTRLAKVFPDIRHDETAPPSQQYPQGGGGLQWYLVTPCPFLLAVRIDANGQAHTPDFSVNLASGDYQSDLDARTRLRKYMEQATP